MIFGATDVVPHQDMKNPAFDPPDDPDQYAYGDLPYACDTAYSRDIATFKGPTRVVGRLPDLTGARDPSHLIALLACGGEYRSQDVTDYGEVFRLIDPILAEVHGTEPLQYVRQLCRAHAGTARADPSIRPAAWRRSAISSIATEVRQIRISTARRAIRSRCRSPATSSRGKIKPGTVAAVECCYGAELYNSVTLSLPLPICQRYLIQGAYGYFGSSTIAYGPEEGNGAADLITQYFLLAILDGASLGRAALLARQRFVEQTAELDPMDLKTLGQFNLLGDPSIHPVVVASATNVPKGVDIEKSSRVERRARRAKMQAAGEMLQETKPTASRKATRARKSSAVRKALANIAREAGIGKRKEFMAFNVKYRRRRRSRGSKAAPAASRYYVAVYRPRAPRRSYSVAAVAKEVGGRIVGYRIYMEK